MAQRVRDIVSDEIIDEDTVKKEVEEAKKELSKEKKKVEKEIEKGEEKKEKVKSKKPAKPKRGKKYFAAKAKIDKEKLYTLDEGIDKVLEISFVKFDPTIEIHCSFSTGGIRSTIILPAGAPTEKKIAEVTEKNIDDFIAKIKAKKFDFDLIIASTAVMPKLATVAKILGPKGMMPSPKSGTVVEDTKKAILEMKSGKIEYHQDDQKNIHLAIAKASWGKEKIKENLEVFIKSLPKNKILGLYLTSTMGPSVKIELPK